MLPVMAEFHFPPDSTHLHKCKIKDPFYAFGEIVLAPIFLFVSDTVSVSPAVFYFFRITFLMPNLSRIDVGVKDYFFFQFCHSTKSNP